MQCISGNLAFLLRLSARLLKITILVTQQKFLGPSSWLYKRNIQNFRSQQGCYLKLFLRDQARYWAPAKFYFCIWKIKCQFLYMNCCFIVKPHFVFKGFPEKKTWMGNCRGFFWQIVCHLLYKLNIIFISIAVF